MTGRLLSLDGIDGGGKSTQVDLLCKWFAQSGREVLALRDPGGTRLGEALREILLHRNEIPLTMTSEMLLYMASRAQLVEEVVRPAMAAGKVVIADRYLLANIVYQGYAGGLDLEAVRRVGEVATGGLQPDLTVVLDLPVATALGRLQGGMDRLESRGAEYMQRVRDGFLCECRRMTTATVIDATQSIEEVHRQLTNAISARGL